MKQDSVADAILDEIAKIAENSVKKYLDNTGRIAIVAENSVKKYIDNTDRIAIVAENSVKKYLDNTERIAIVAENSVAENAITENANTENGLIISRIRKTAENCLRNYFEKKHTKQNYLESSIDITSMKNNLPIIDTNQKPFTANQTILEPMTDIDNSDSIVSKTNNSNGIVNESTTKTNNNNGIVNEPTTKTNNNNGIVNEPTTKTNNNNNNNNNNNGIVNESTTKTYDNGNGIVNEPTTKSNNNNNNNGIVDEGVSKTYDNGSVNEPTTKSNNDNNNGIVNEPTTKTDNNNGIVNDGVSKTNNNGIVNESVRNNDNGKDTTNKTIIDSNISSLTPLPATVSDNNTTMHDTSSDIDKTRADDMMIETIEITKKMMKNDTSNNEFNSEEQDNGKKTQEINNVRNARNKSQVLPIASKPLLEMMNEISKTAINVVTKFIVKNNETNDPTKQDTTDRRVDTELNKVRVNRSKHPVLPVASNKTEPLHDASITLYDVNYNGKENDIITKTLLKISPDGASKFIIL